MSFALCGKTTPNKRRAGKLYGMAMNRGYTEKGTTNPSLRK